MFFIIKSKNEFVVVAVYVDDLNLIGTPIDLTETVAYLMKEFEMKNLRKTRVWSFRLNIY